MPVNQRLWYNEDGRTVLTNSATRTKVIGNQGKTMRRLELIATVTADGMLTIPVPADVVPGTHAVIVEIDERTLGAEHHDERDWLTFVQETAGAWRGDFERLPQGAYEDRAAF